MKTSFMVTSVLIFSLKVASFGIAQEPIGPKIDTLMASPALKGGIQGIVIQSLKTGKVWYEHNADLHFVPASNQKLLTATATLAELGADYTFKTQLIANKPMTTDGQIDGDLFLKGSGDPIFSLADIDTMVSKLKSAGLKSITGKIIADASRFDRTIYGYGWEWDDMPFYYSAPVSGLNLNENMASVMVTPGKAVGSAIKYSVSPITDQFEIINRATTGAKNSKETLNVTRVLGKPLVLVTGVVPIDKKFDLKSAISVTVENPPIYAVRYLSMKLRRAGIRCGGIGEGTAPSLGETIVEHISPPLSEILTRMNKPSDNLIAECLLKTLGAEKSANHIGTTNGGRDAAMAWYKLHGVDISAIHMVDGSGLSRHNLVSPRAYSQMLKAAYELPTFKTLYDSMPIVGVDGTARNRLKGTLAQGNSHIKDGYVEFVSSLSGYVKTRNGEDLLFVMFMNNHTSPNSEPKAVQDAILKMLAEWKSES